MFRKLNKHYTRVQFLYQLTTRHGRLYLELYITIYIVFVMFMVCLLDLKIWVTWQTLAWSSFHIVPRISLTGNKMFYVHELIQRAQISSFDDMHLWYAISIKHMAYFSVQLWCFLWAMKVTYIWCLFITVILLKIITVS